MKAAVASRTLAMAVPRARRRLTPRGRRAFVPLLLVVLWSLASAAGWLSPAVLPSPWAVLGAALRLGVDGVLFEAVGISLYRFLAGFALGAVAGVGLGVLVALWSRGEQLLDGTMQALRAIPFLALAPMFSLWFGAGEASRIALVAFGAMFPLYLNTISGVHAVDRRLAESAHAVGVHGWGVVREIALPGALPSMLVGARLSFSWALAALVSAEIIGAPTGIGALIAQAREFVQVDVIFLCVVVYALLGLAADALVRWLEWRLLAWRRTFAGQ
ncbi:MULTISPECIES: ABC transporter permease [unclassified Variovorax]|uniref:ABC transporter permease n=1 Tax=unclassified Variovorax TaxID=663243 RepID=UPI002576621C|nr:MULTISPECIES: ABC transporter permease [unclassified Variovorax]MDM0089168.1 ABC transporter permease [Variovorax sp. J22G40]MDM0147241.1 ABC transporter permease [Variovorax sp. J2P1-31]